MESVYNLPPSSENKMNKFWQITVHLSTLSAAGHAGLEIGG
jgi:hypothetical protein